jgi:translation initiation factor eIF-2B subunit epsilon
MSSRKQVPPNAASSGSQRKPHSTVRESGSSLAGSNRVDQPEEDPLVAVILADSYDDHFAPLTLNWPRCLLPIADVPLLHFSVESATRTGVSHIYILTRAHAQRIRQHVENHLKVTLQAQGIVVTVISMPEALSEGDALRDLDAKQVLRSDFLLYRADSVVTFDLKSIVLEHRQRRLADKDAIMTLCCMQTGEGIAMRSKATSSVHCIDPTKDQLLHTETLFASQRTRATLPLELLQFNDRDGCEEVDIRHDLVESGVYICSVDVPPLFSENFDYQSLQDDFIPGILTSDLLESKIFVHVGKRGYGGRAQDTQTYDSISKDILRHWTSPIHPASTSWIGERFTEKRGWRYIGQAVKSDRSCGVGPCSMIASRCVLSEQVRILESVLCSDVKIGKRSIVFRSHLHNHASVGDNVSLSHCIIGRGAQVLENVVLGHGCIVGADCIIGPDVSLPAGTRVGLRAKESWDEDDLDDSTSQCQPSEDSIILNQSQREGGDLGARSKGFLWPNLWNQKGRDSYSYENHRAGEEGQDGETTDEEDLPEDAKNLRIRAFGFASQSKAESVSEDCASEASSFAYDSDFGDEDRSSSGDANEVQSGFVLSTSKVAITDLTLDDKDDSNFEKQANQARIIEFEAEARASLARAFSENHSIDNASLELKTLRMASNVETSDVQRVIVQFLLEQSRPNDPKQIQTLFSRWGTLLANGAQEDEVLAILHMQVGLSTHSPHSNSHIWLHLHQKYCADHSAYVPVFVPLLKLFYNNDIVSDEAIVAWWRSKLSQTGDENAKSLRMRAQGVVRYILESEDGDDDDDEDAKY